MNITRAENHMKKIFVLSVEREEVLNIHSVRGAGISLRTIQSIISAVRTLIGLLNQRSCCKCSFLQTLNASGATGG